VCRATRRRWFDVAPLMVLLVIVMIVAVVAVIVPMFISRCQRCKAHTEKQFHQVRAY
jgi:hypothetical protein